MIWLRTFVLPAIASILVSCGSGNDTAVDPGKPDQCNFFTGAATVTTAPVGDCPDCSASNAERAADANFVSAAVVSAGYHPSNNCTLLSCEPPGAIEIRATAQPGVVFPSGNYAGAWVNFACNSDWDARARTYSNGQLQDEGTPLNTCSSSGDPSYISVKATKPFDAAAIVLKHHVTDQTTIQVPEICSDAQIAHIM